MQSTLQSLHPYKYFIDLDLRSASHQLLLDYDTSQRLSVQPARAEFERMSGYFYEASDSPWASPLVVASKAAAPLFVFV